MQGVLILTAVGEALTGVALLIVPSLVGRLLFGEELSGITIPLARLTGIALFALGIACWPRRETGNDRAQAFWAMLTYSLLVTLYLAYLGGIAHLVGRWLWPAVALHIVFVLLLVRAWRKERQQAAGSTR